LHNDAGLTALHGAAHKAALEEIQLRWNGART
jgi:hypothetical protein